MAIRAIRASRTVSAEAALILAGMIPFEILARVHARIYWKSRASVRNGTTQRQVRRRVAAAILPNWDGWLEAGPDTLTYRKTQVLTGDGCFGKYLQKIGAEATARCHHCEEEADTAQHTVEECQAFSEQRGALKIAIGDDLSPMELIKALIAGGTKRDAVNTFCEEVMSMKEAAEKDRERVDNSRRRRGRRGRPPNERRQEQGG